MIQIRMMKKSDVKSVDQMLREDQLEFEALFLEIEQCFVVEDGSRICGLSGYRQLEEEKAELVYLYIREEDRGFKLGDGLLRATLNHLDHKKIRQIYITSNERTDGFFVAEGLEIAMKSGENLVFRAELPDFFNTPCKSSRGNA